MIVKNYPIKKQPSIQQATFKPPICPSCKRNKWLEFDKGEYCQKCENFINKHKHQVDKKVLRQDGLISTRLPKVNKRSRENYYSMGVTKYNTTKDMTNKLQSLKGKTKLQFYQNVSKDFDEMNYWRRSNTFHFEEDNFF